MIAAAALALLLAAPDSAADPRREQVTDALVALNIFVEAATYADVCSGANDSLTPVRARIDRAIARTTAAYADLSADVGVGDTDYRCQRRNPPERWSPDPARRHALKLVAALERALDGGTPR